MAKNAGKTLSTAKNPPRPPALEAVRLGGAGHAAGDIDAAGREMSRAQSTASRQRLPTMAASPQGLAESHCGGLSRPV